MFLEEYLKITKKKEKKTLKTIDSKTCSNKLRVRMLVRIPQKLEQCIGCNNYQANYECKNFKPYQFTFPVRTGIYAAISQSMQ